MNVSFLALSPLVTTALHNSLPIVALESTVITHGLPYPQNLQLALDMEAEVAAQGAVPATIAVLDGRIHAGLEREQLERLASGSGMHKISARDFAPAAALGWSGGTTVAGTLLVAARLGIRVFATGGIGGVHRGSHWDVSADLPQLARSPVIVVCAGAKAILDLPGTLEYLETHSVPVVGWQTDDFPAFYSVSSGLKVPVRADTIEQVAQIARAHWELGQSSGILLAVPPPIGSALPPEQVEQAIQTALQELEQRGVSGQAVTPFLLERVSRLTHGASLQVNLELLKNNARIAAELAVQLGRSS